MIHIDPFSTKSDLVQESSKFVNYCPPGPVHCGNFFLALPSFPPHSAHIPGLPPNMCSGITSHHDPATCELDFRLNICEQFHELTPYFVPDSLHIPSQVVPHEAAMGKPVPQEYKPPLLLEVKPVLLHTAERIAAAICCRFSSHVFCPEPT
ncbi:hypothetical protein DPMN_063588 [Dreissena polymorpha]|uniref:Uncharacterized protein n=1 Tax=Dreissena polymorpha TaxID=45954 RepID=A0A9D4CBM4_DREPO|nr:hypothetical protein DPMN_063588 [Dreissena polymorpha]